MKNDKERESSNRRLGESDEQDARNERDARRESGLPGGGAGRRDEVGPTGVYPMSAGIPPGKHPELRTPAAWGQGERGAEGYDDAGGSELVMRDGQLLGGLTSGPSGEPTIDIHSADAPTEHEASSPPLRESETERRRGKKSDGR